MSNASALGALEYEAESVFGENTSTFATHRIPILGPVDVSGLVHKKDGAGRAVQYASEDTQDVLMDMTGSSFSMEMDLPGHGATMVGSPTIDALETFLGLIFGAAALSAAASTTASAGTATALTTASSGAFTPGALFRCGVLGDGKGNGQMFPIATCVTTTLTSLVAMDGAPTAADVVYPVTTISVIETPTTFGAVTGLRFRALTANTSYELHGCYPTALAISGLNAGNRPKLKITFAVSWWKYSTATFPSALASNKYNPAPVTAGSWSVNDFGTATRAKRTCRDFKIDISWPMAPLMGPGGANAYQACIGARRLPPSFMVTWTEDADANTLTPTLPGLGTATTYKHGMYTASTNDSSALGFYFPRLKVTNVALQKNDGGVNRFTITAKSVTSTTTTSDLTMSAFRMGWG